MKKFKNTESAQLCSQQLCEPVVALHAVEVVVCGPLARVMAPAAAAAVAAAVPAQEGGEGLID